MGQLLPPAQLGLCMDLGHVNARLIALLGSLTFRDACVLFAYVLTLPQVLPKTAGFWCRFAYSGVLFIGV